MYPTFQVTHFSEQDFKMPDFVLVSSEQERASLHGVNSEYYAIQWFLTLYASDLRQEVVRRIWDRFLVAGWRVVAQIGLALLYRIQDSLIHMDTCQALSFLKRFTRNAKFTAKELLDTAATFKVSHRMLSALEAAYGWPGESQLTVVKDLNSGQVHWIVQAVQPKLSCAYNDSPDAEYEEPAVRSFARASTSGEGDRNCPQGKVLPFLLHNLDTGETTMMEKAFSQYKGEMHEQARAKAGPAQAAPSAAEMPALSGELSEYSDMPAGSFWMQTVQRQAERGKNHASHLPYKVRQSGLLELLVGPCSCGPDMGRKKLPPEEEAVVLANVAERAERYEDMVDYMKERVKAGKALAREEREMFAAAYKGLMASRRFAVRVAKSVQEQEADAEKEKNAALAAGYLSKVRLELQGICIQVLEILEGILLPKAETGEPKVFYLKLQADYYRYLAEFLEGEGQREALASAAESYVTATGEAEKHLMVTHPVRLGVALNHAVFKHTVMKDPAAAAQIVKESLELAARSLEGMPEEAVRDAQPLVAIMQDNLRMWLDEASS
ncbi:BMH2 [Symbiodinium sp. CCMP2592]|nr:BMH2 [Symbiodinium sp. CCMP2592]